MNRCIKKLKICRQINVNAYLQFLHKLSMKENQCYYMYSRFFNSCLLTMFRMFSILHHFISILPRYEAAIFWTIALCSFCQTFSMNKATFIGFTIKLAACSNNVVSLKGSIPPALATMYSAMCLCLLLIHDCSVRSLLSHFHRFFTTVPYPSKPNDNGGGPDRYLLLHCS